MTAIIRFFLSLKTASVFFFAFTVITFIGSIVLPGNLAFFSGIDDVPLFKWLKEADSLKLTWWIYALIAMLSLLAISTIFCTAEAILKKISREKLMLRLSPQVMHIGVLFIMLGHLLTAAYGFKADVLIKKGENKLIRDKTGLYLEDINVITDKNGYDIGWQARLRLSDVWGKKEGILRPAHPFYGGGFGFYIKSANPDSALIRVCRDPGALWALSGGILLSLGGLCFVYSRFMA